MFLNDISYRTTLYMTLAETREILFNTDQITKYNLFYFLLLMFDRLRSEK